MPDSRCATCVDYEHPRMTDQNGRCTSRRALRLISGPLYSSPRYGCVFWRGQDRRVAAVIPDAPEPELSEAEAVRVMR